MDLPIALLLGQDGLANGAVYALLALALVLVFAVTRVIFIPEGEFVAWGALTLAALQAGQFPGTAWVLLACGAAASALDAVALRAEPARLLRALGWQLGYPLALVAALKALPLAGLPLGAQVALALATVVPLAPMVYRLAFQPIADATVLTLLIVAVAVHVAMLGLGLLFFGPEGARTPALSDASFTLGPLDFTGQSLAVMGSSLALIVGLWLFFSRTLAGRALRASALNRRGARLVGISPVATGRLAFGLAGAIGALSGVLVAPVTTVYYDSGFLISLKGFVAAIVGGLASYPAAALAAVFVGLLESFSSFWASAFKDVIVFTLIIPVLVWRSLQSHHIEEDA
ncbi:branched-chain amino acid ABC transporter permease [Derxia gummosa]|uniref:Branched-chain amino acid ABC transporter permease n=1 Tax=Derxia gummosa DSM 723 TaxID=1121388 RepID=A0A8B6X5J2_9BURK|nr:branched-chain amino acid ABC transporter permease [Derxia gummosa]